MKNITVLRRAHDYHACISGQPQYWAKGRTPAEAIGDLILSHAEQFGTAVEMKQTAWQWADQEGIEIVDADGWKKNDGISLYTPINKQEWESRRDESTICPLKPIS